MRWKATQGPRGRRGKWLIVTLGIVVVVGIVLRLVLDPIATHFTRKALNEGQDMRGTFARVHVSVLPPAYEISRVKLIELPDGRWDEPLLYVEHARVVVLWRELFRGHLIAQAELHRPKFTAGGGTKAKEKKVEKSQALGERLEQAMPLKLDRITVTDGEVLIAQGHGPKAPSLWLNHMDLVAENLATRKALMDGEPSKLRLEGVVQRSGKLAVNGTMAPFAKGLTFTIKAALRDLDLRELYAFVAPQAKLVASHGTADVFVELRARDGVLTGGVKPMLKDVNVKTVDDDLGGRIKEALADTAITILEDDERPSGHDVVATTIPIKGTLKDPHVQVLPAVLGAVRNGLVTGLASGFTNLPPRTAGEKEGAVEQAVNALKKDEGPPRAQPEPRQGRAAGKRNGGRPGGERAPEGRDLNP